MIAFVEEVKQEICVDLRFVSFVFIGDLMKKQMMLIFVPLVCVWFFLVLVSIGVVILDITLRQDISDLLYVIDVVVKVNSIVCTNNYLYILWDTRFVSGMHKRFQPNNSLFLTFLA